MSMFEKAGWLYMFSYLMIDAAFDTVTVIKKVSDFPFFLSFVHLLIFSRLQR